jgi:hypothetical protein
MTSVWSVSQTDYDIDPDSNGQVKVTNLHWRTMLEDGLYTATSYGSTPDDQNRVYTLAALQNVPESVVVGWVQAALGAEEVQRIEAALLASIAEQKNPTSGGITY